MINVISILPNNQRTPVFIENSLKEAGHSRLAYKINDIANFERSCLTYKPEVILYSRTPGIANNLRKLKWDLRNERTKFVLWNVDTRREIENFGKDIIDTLSTADYIFTISNDNVQKYKNMFPDKKVFHLMQGIYPQINKRYQITDSDMKKYGCDVMFSGDLKASIHNNRSQLLSKIARAGYKIKIYGNRDYIINEELSRAIACSKIALDISTLVDLSCSFSVRIWEILGAGGFLLSPDHKDFDMALEPDIHCGIYKDADDCLKQIEYYLNNPVIRETIADNGYKYAHENATYVHRIKEMFKIIRSN
jgi:spore maturation protein CgeB